MATLSQEASDTPRMSRASRINKDVGYPASTWDVRRPLSRPRRACGAMLLTIKGTAGGPRNTR